MTLRTDNLKAGMELAADVLTESKMLLLGKGTILTERHLRLLQTWEVPAVNIVASEAEEAGAASASPVTPEILQAAERQVARRLRHVNLNLRAAGAIKELAVTRLAQQLAMSALADRSAGGKA